jgi:hypothetical protein
MGTSGRQRIGWPQREPRVRRPRVSSGLLDHHASIIEFENFSSVKASPANPSPGGIQNSRSVERMCGRVFA